MPDPNEQTISRSKLIELLNEDLAREYQAIIAYVAYSQVLKGAAYMAIAKELDYTYLNEHPAFAGRSTSAENRAHSRLCCMAR